MTSPVTVPTSTKTGLAIATSIVLFIPFIVVGGIVAFIYKLFLKFMLITLTWLPFYSVLESIALNWFGGMLHGLTAAGLAVGAALVVFKHAQPQAVARATALTWISLLVILTIMTVSIAGVSYGLLESIAFAIGIGIGSHIAISN